LVFRPYTQLIRGLFNARQFGPPRPVTDASTWPCVAHPVSGLPYATLCFALFRLAFASAPAFRCLNLATHGNSLAHYAKGTLSGIITIIDDQRPLTGCKRTVSDTISLPLSGYFSPFPCGTSSLSVTNTYLALDNGLPKFTQDSTCPVLLERTTHSPMSFRLRDFHSLWLAFPDHLTKTKVCNCVTSL
jgi:hypothetical protein